MHRYLLLGFFTLMSVSAFCESEYETWLKQNSFDANVAQQEFQDYMDANDKEFVGFLKQQWKQVELKKPIVLDTTPKPIELPKAELPEPTQKPVISNAPEPIVVIKPDLEIAPILKPKPIFPPRPPAISNMPKAERVNFDFIGHQLSMPKVKSNSLKFKQKPNSKSIAKHWEVMAKLNHKPLLNAVKSYQDSLNLNDWAVALLAFEYSKALGLRDTNSQQLFTWFLLVKSGYDARLAYNHSAFLLMPSAQSLFGVTYFTLDRKKYYAVSLDGKQVNAGQAFTYAGKHDSANKSINFSGTSEINPSNHIKSKQLSFDFDGEKHLIRLSYDFALVEFSNTLPQLGIEYYPQQGLPQATSQQLLKQLRPLVKDKTEFEAVNLILRFVQTAFSYKTDGQQFQQENYLLPIETLHYPYSDCEDRASLFSWLVESLLGLDAVLLDYPGHIAAAIHFTETPAGDQLSYQGRTYTVTDPTFINARAGMAMPQFKNTKPKILNF
ncbi:MAG: hypothetical protein ACJAYK_000709 [Crocinitomicaceae bacterium]|jgi:hypothetical protein